MSRILIIDDEPDISELLQAVLTRAGYLVMVAPDGKAGMALHRADPADLVITDIFMPEKDGLEVIRHFRRDHPTVPIIAMSGRPQLANVMEIAAKFGAHRLLVKPFHPRELLDAVTDALRLQP